MGYSLSYLDNLLMERIHYRNVRGLGKSMVVFRLFEKLNIQMKDQL